MDQLDPTRTSPSPQGSSPIGTPRAPERAFVEPIAGLLDGAHVELPTRELAALLLALEGPAAELAAGGHPDLEAGVPPLGLSPLAQARLSPIRQLLRLAAAGGTNTGRDAGQRARLGDWLRQYLEEVAARPRGAAVPDL
jgi:hypothetical protein